MSLQLSPEINARSGLRSVCFNQDGSCLLATRNDGYSVYNVDPFRELVRRQFTFGGVRHIAMLYRTSLLAIVFDPKSNSQAKSPVEFAGVKIDATALESTLFIYDDATNKVLGHVAYPTPILRICLRHDRLLVCLEDNIHIHSLTNLQLIDSIPTAKNPSALMAVSTAPLSCPLRAAANPSITTIKTATTSAITPDAATMVSRQPFVLLPPQDEQQLLAPIGLKSTKNKLSGDGESSQQQGQEGDSVTSTFAGGAVLYDKFCGITPVNSQLTALHYLHSFIVAYPSPHSQGSVGVRYYCPSLNAHQITPTRIKNGPSCVDIKITPASEPTSNVNDMQRTENFTCLRKQIDMLPKMITTDSYIEAAKTSLGCISMSENGTFMAVASTEGTVIRVYDTISTHLVATWRRGKDAARITSIVFDPNNSVAVVSSSKGTAHVFSIDSSPTSMKQSEEADSAARNAVNTFNIINSKEDNNSSSSKLNLTDTQISSTTHVTTSEVEAGNQEFLQRNSTNLKKAQQYYGGFTQTYTVASNSSQQQFLGGSLNVTSDVEKKPMLRYRQNDEKTSVIATFTENICTLGVCNDRAEFHKVGLMYETGLTDIKVKWLMCENELMQHKNNRVPSPKKKR